MNALALIYCNWSDRFYREEERPTVEQHQQGLLLIQTTLALAEQDL